MTRRREPQNPYNPLETLRRRPGIQDERSASHAASGPAAARHDAPTTTHQPASLPRPRRMPCIRVGLQPDRKLAFERLCHRLGGSLDASLPPSQVLRVCCELLLEHQDVLLSESHALGPLHRPPNDDHAAMRRFERALCELVLRGLRSPLRPSDRSCDTVA